MIQIRIVYQKDWIQSVRISGHAQANEPGKDLVCAGVSSIATGMLNALDQYFPKAVKLTLVDDIDPLIEIVINQQNPELNVVMQVFITQLETMEASYSDFVQIIRRNNQ